MRIRVRYIRTSATASPHGEPTTATVTATGAIAPDMSRSLTGEPTPLALLPNGKMIRVGAASSDTTAVSETGTETAASTATATAVLDDIEPDAVPELTHIVPTTFWQRLKFVFRGNS